MVAGGGVFSLGRRSTVVLLRDGTPFRFLGRAFQRRRRGRSRERAAALSRGNSSVGGLPIPLLIRTVLLSEVFSVDNVDI